MLPLFLLLLCHLAQQVNIHQLYDSYLMQYDKHYSQNEKLFREQLFKQNYYEINKINSNNHTYILGINLFSDMTQQEISSHFAYSQASQSSQYLLGTHVKSEIKGSLPNWIAQGVVNTPRYQYHCANCYAFTIISTVESLYAIHYGTLPSFSEQELTDCALPYGARGCGGGSDQAYNYIAEFGIHLDRDYLPFQGFYKGSCSRNDNIPPFYKIKGYVKVPPFDNDALLSALMEGPVFITSYVNRVEFINYKSGVLDIPDCNVLPEHAMTLVGAGTEGGIDYWIIKNSWSVYWGDNGFLRMKRESGKSIGMCGMNLYGYYPVDQMSVKHYE